MKIQCNACGAAEAAVLCCADEAALCAACDEEVHAANKLAGKHQRVPLIASAGPGVGVAAAPPKCDICQEGCGYFFCLEDRALLCMDCDVSIHTVNPYVSAHQRFLLTGVQVGLEPAEPVAPVANKQLNGMEGPVVNSPLKSLARGSCSIFSRKSTASLSIQKEVNRDYSRKNSFSSTSTRLPDLTVANAAVRSAQSPAKSFSEGKSSMLLSGEISAAFPSQISRAGGLSYGLPFSGGTMSSNLPDWPMDEYIGATEYNNFSFGEHGFPKDDISKPGSSDSSPKYRLVEGLDTDEFLSLVPENSWTVPEVPSPPTASGLCWEGNLHYPAYENTTSVPDVSPHGHLTGAVGFKRRRRQF